MAILWLKEETYGQPSPDTRAPILPMQTAELVRLGHTVRVERSNHRIFPDELYENEGKKAAKEVGDENRFQMVPSGSWCTEAPPEALVLGIKYLPKEGRWSERFPVTQMLSYFAHYDNGDLDAQRILSRIEERYAQGPDPKPFFDLEGLTDENGRRVAAFGFFAGYAGTLLALKTWAEKEMGALPPYTAPDLSMGRQAMVSLVDMELSRAYAWTGREPKALVIAPDGRCGKGAVALLDELGIKHTDWRRAETEKGPPFPEIFQHDILLNCVAFDAKNPKFVTREDLESNHRLSVVGDISCYPGPFNPVDIYQRITSYDRLTHTATPQNKKAKTVDVVAVENLPRLLAADASTEYATALFPHIKDLMAALDKNGPYPPVWQRSLDHFHANMAPVEKIKDLGMLISSSCFDTKVGQFKPEKANAMVMTWLENHPLTVNAQIGFRRHFLDGTSQTYDIRAGKRTGVVEEEYKALEKWIATVDVAALCERDDIKKQHLLLQGVDKFLMSPEGRKMMEDPALTKQFYDLVDAASLAIKDEGKREKVEELLKKASKKMAVDAELKGADSRQAALIQEGFMMVVAASRGEVIQH